MSHFSLSISFLIKQPTPPLQRIILVMKFRTMEKREYVMM